MYYSAGVLAAKAVRFPVLLCQRPGHALHQRLFKKDPNQIHMTDWLFNKAKDGPTGRLSRYLGCVNGFKQLLRLLISAQSRIGVRESSRR